MLKLVGCYIPPTILHFCHIIVYRATGFYIILLIKCDDEQDYGYKCHAKWRQTEHIQIHHCF